ASSLGDGELLVNTATAGSKETESTTPASWTTEIHRLADVSIAKSVSASTAIARSPFIYTVTASNPGPSGASGVMPAATPPPSLLLTAPRGCAGGLTCVIGLLPAGASTTVIVAASLDPSAADGQSYANTATISAAETDPSNVDNTASATVTAKRSADLMIAK